ncbi:diaminopimelate decarboxylase [Sedimentibacter sp. zth1]|uniref:diaminopimelate decarboxylase n=1 Tax=Sedimentibacter sp. zth1 TaxID=2816908 RepID=UPI001A92D596|nr:diaminopimelate decarboxylase [Sedimentibacter sp. zth1]QSX04891.1 diaminopimelate decarboxylase [Sedimentibacter sp. zth1]
MIKKVKDNILYFDGCNTVELAQKYGTPIYVYSKNKIIKKCRELKKCFINKYQNVRVAYAAKAFLTLTMCKIINEEQLCLDVVSGGELFIALKSGFPADKIEFNGNNKTQFELEYAIENDIGRIIVDSLTEVEIIENICRNKNKKVKVLFRITPGVNINSHEYVATGKKDSKFGIPIEEGILFPYVKKAIDSKFVNFLGFHFHIGSQLHDNKPYLIALETSLKLIKDLKSKYNFVVEEINIGGGFGIRYTDEDNVKPYSYFLDPIMKRIIEFFNQITIPIPTVVIEPGRSIVGEAGMTLYEVGNIKEIKGVRTYVAVDGGMTDNIRPALYNSKHDCLVANKASTASTEKYTICGKCCESGDILIKDVYLPKIVEHDFIAVFSTGAYGYSMASNYNKNTIPAVILVSDGKSKIIVKRQTYDGLIENDVLVDL